MLLAGRQMSRYPHKGDSISNCSSSIYCNSNSDNDCVGEPTYPKKLPGWYECKDMPRVIISNDNHNRRSSVCGGSAMERAWGPYIDNGGTVVAVAGDNYAVVAADTRISVGYSIHTRNFSKITRLTSKCIIATSGMQAEMLTLHKLMKNRIVLYEHTHRSQPSTECIAQTLSTVLYNKRFFPFYTFNVIVGIDSEGKGACYQYDAIGSFEKYPYVSAGSGGALMMSILDNQLGKLNQSLAEPPLSKTETIDLVKDVITSATERDIFTGDSADVVVVDESGFDQTSLPLRKD